MSLGSKLKQIRISKQMMQKDVYESLGISNNTYSNYENDKREPDFKTLVCIADFLDVSVDYLLGRTDDSSPLKCNTEQKIKCPKLCDKDLQKAHRIGTNDYRLGLPCDLKCSDDLKLLLSRFLSNSNASALIGEAWTKGWLCTALQIQTERAVFYHEKTI